MRLKVMNLDVITHHASQGFHTVCHCPGAQDSAFFNLFGESMLLLIAASGQL